MFGVQGNLSAIDRQVSVEGERNRGTALPPYMLVLKIFAALDLMRA